MNRHARFHALPVLLFLLGVPLLGAERGHNPNPLIGTWTVVSVHVNGERQRNAEWEHNDEVTFEGENVVGLYTGDKGALSKVELYSDKKPKQFARFLYGDRRREVFYLWGIGIYSLSGDTLRWCEVEPGQPVPMELTTTIGDKRTLIVLERKKLTPNASE